ncbi:MAG: hypothetical protein AB7F28_02850 [Candidatus Margulisiibacteriota bacterium]
MKLVSGITRFLVGLLLANVASMMAMTVMGFSSDRLGLVFGFLFVCSIAMAPLPRFELRWRPSRRDWLWSLLIVLFLMITVAFARFPYCYEGVVHQVSAGVTGDDAWHIQEIVSLVKSRQFPPLYGMFQRDYLLFYYAPWMMMGALFSCLPLSWASVKLAYALGYGAYALLVVPCVFGLIGATAGSRSQYWAMVFLVVGHAGMQSFNVLSFPLVSHENWMGHYHIYVQFSAFTTLLLWVMHHVLAALALVLAYRYLRQADPCKILAWREGVCIGGLAAFALMSSPFVCLGAAPLGVYALWVHRKWAFRQGLLSAFTMLVLVSPMIWMYLQKKSDFRFFFNILAIFPTGWTVSNWVVSGLVFLILVVMEFSVPVALGVRMWRNKIQIQSEDRVLLTLAVLMVLSTFFVGYGIYNNYAMRASILPVAIGLVTLGRYSDQLPVIPPGKLRKFVVFWCAIMILGSLNEIGAVWKQSYHEWRLMQTPQSVRAMVYRVNHQGEAGDDRLRWRIETTNASYYHLVERPLAFQFPYHENDLDLVGPPPKGLWHRLDWQYSR